MSNSADLADLLRKNANRLRRLENRRDLHRDAERLEHVSDWLATVDELPKPRGDWPCVLCVAEPGQECFEGEPDRFHHQRGFAAGREVEDTETCRASVQSGPGRIWRPCCTGCEWLGEIVESEGLAVEFSHDHSFPGWRAMPNVPSMPYLHGGGNSKADREAMEKWLTIVNSILPEGWLERGGPIKTHRGGYPSGSRHVPGRAPGGGYDMCGSIDDSAFILSALEGNHLRDFLPGAHRVAAKKRLRDRPGSWGRATGFGLVRSDREPLAWDEFFKVLEQGCENGRREVYDAALHRWTEWVKVDRASAVHDDPETAARHRRQDAEISNDLRRAAHAIVMTGVERCREVGVGETMTLF